jgi:hypothetical protein
VYKHFNKGVPVNKPAAKTAEKVIPKKVFKISIEFYPGGKAKIHRKDLSALIDTTEFSVAWLKAHDFKEEDIELIGDKPDCWETSYPAPVVKLAPLAEKIEEALSAPPADTITVTTVNLDSGNIVQEQVKDVFEGIPDPITHADVTVVPPPDPIEQALGVKDVQSTKLEDKFDYHHDEN